jgi:DNA gyrase subunit A
MGRATQGVRIINLEKRNDEIASVCKVMSATDDESIAESSAEGESPVSEETTAPDTNTQPTE